MRKREIYKLEEVFTPSSPAYHTYIERNIVNKRLERALRTRGKQIIIYGYSGAGKTTLLLNKLRNQEVSFIITRCTSNMSLKDIILDAFNKLDVSFTEISEHTKGGKIDGKAGASIMGISVSVSSDVSELNKKIEKRVTNTPLTEQSLVEYLGKSGKIWILEDFHKIKEEEKTGVSQIMKLFMDASFEYPTVKIVAIGAVNSAREVLKYEPEMRNRISEIEVPLMLSENLEKIIDKGSELLNIIITKKTRAKIVAYSYGLPAITHQLCSLLCDINGVLTTHDSASRYSIDDSTFSAVLDEYILENSDTFKSIYEVATKITHKRKFDNPKDIFEAILSCDDSDGATINEMKDFIKTKDNSYNGNNLMKYVDELTTVERGEILRKNNDSDKYYFQSPFVKSYFKSCIVTESKQINSVKASMFKDILAEELEYSLKIFLKDAKENNSFEYEDVFIDD